MKALLYLEFLEIIKKKLYLYLSSLILLCMGIYLNYIFSYIFIFIFFLDCRNFVISFEMDKKINRYILTTKICRKDLIKLRFLVSTLKIFAFSLILFFLTLFLNYNFLLTLTFYFFTALIVNPLIQLMSFYFYDESDIFFMWLIVFFTIIICLILFKYAFGVNIIYKNIIIFYIIMNFFIIFWNYFLFKKSIKKIKYIDF